jgi:hypothetical protein
VWANVWLGEEQWVEEATVSLLPLQMARLLRWQ